LKRLVLAGGGHSHIAVLKSFGDAPPGGAALCLLSPHRHIAYSGMMPGLIAGHYSWADCHIDLEPLAARARARFVRDAAAGIDTARREVITAGGERIAYDLVSLDTGSTLQVGESRGVEAHAICVKPIERFLPRWEELRRSAHGGGLRRIAVVGGGPAGVEVLLAMRHRLATESAPAVNFALFTDTPHILAGHNQRVRRALERILAARGVEPRAGRKVAAVSAGGVELEGGERIEAQATVSATGPAAPAWIVGTGLRTDAHGFVAVNDRLQALSHPEVFAAGDVATIIDQPRPKSGVFAVRQGPALARNLRLALAGATPRAFSSSSRALALISCGERYAVASWEWLALEGVWVWRWKDWIDRRFVAQYRVAA